MVSANVGPGRLPGWRPILVALVMIALVAIAGCSSATNANQTTAQPTTTAANPATTAAASTGTTTAGSPSTSTPSAKEGGTGLLTVVVGNQEIPDSAASSSSSFGFNDSEPHTWHAERGVTLSQALSTMGVNATANTLTYQGRTYDGSVNGTTVSIRANGKPVDPTTYALHDGDRIWVSVETPYMQRSVPGQYIPDGEQHIHGHMAFVVNGQPVNFSQPRYQVDDRYFHYEDGSGKSWHAHSWSITLQYALSSLDGIEVSADGQTITYDGTTYRASDPGTTITIQVNGQPVQPGSYYLKDWDHVRVEIQSGA